MLLTTAPWISDIAVPLVLATAAGTWALFLYSRVVVKSTLTATTSTMREGYRGVAFLEIGNDSSRTVTVTVTVTMRCTSELDLQTIAGKTNSAEFKPTPDASSDEWTDPRVSVSPGHTHRAIAFVLPDGTSWVTFDVHSVRHRRWRKDQPHLSTYVVFPK